jgi:hypothetical protein
MSSPSFFIMELTIIKDSFDVIKREVNQIG